MSHGGEDHEAHEHPGCAPHESASTTGFFDYVESGEGEGEVYGAENHAGYVAVAEACGFENCGAVVEELWTSGRSVGCIEKKRRK